MDVILGGGVTGLSLGWKLEERKRPYLILEREPEPGGLCRSMHLEVPKKGFFHFDLAGHVLHLRAPEMKTKLAPFLKTCVSLERQAWIHVAGKMIPYPFQAHIAHLPAPLAEQCLRGFLKAWASGAGQDDPRRPFSEWVDAAFGEGIAKYFMRPYNQKLWTVPLNKLTCEWMGRFVPQPSLDDVIKGFMGTDAAAMGYNPTFYYPREGGIEGMVKWLRGRLAPKHLRTGASVEEIDPDERVVVLKNGERIPYQRLYSTLPMPEFITRLKGAPERMKKAARRLKSNSLWVLYLALDHPVDADRHWVYLPEKKYSFYRVGFPSNLTERNAPKGCGSLLVERAVSAETEVDPKVWSQEVIGQLVALGWIQSPASVLKWHAVRLPRAYVIYDRYQAPSVEAIQKYVRGLGIESIGRFGAWEYSSIEDNIRAGFQAASK